MQEIKAEFTPVDVVDNRHVRFVIFYTRGVKVETDGFGELFFNGSKAKLTNTSGNLYTAYGLIYRTKNPKRVIGARKRKKALQASVRKYAVKINFIRED